MQVTVQMAFDNDFVLAVHGPVCSKDIRHGLEITDEEASELVEYWGHILGEKIKERSVAKIYADIAPPPYGPRFSAN